MFSDFSQLISDFFTSAPLKISLEISFSLDLMLDSDFQKYSLHYFRLFH